MSLSLTVTPRLKSRGSSSGPATGERVWASARPREAPVILLVSPAFSACGWAGQPCTVGRSVLNSQGGSRHQPQVKYLFQMHHFLESLTAGYQELDWP